MQRLILHFVLLVTLKTLSAEFSCPEGEGWQKVENSDSCVLFVKEPKNFFEASKHCKNFENSDLASCLSPDEFTHINNNMINNLLWIGYTYLMPGRKGAGAYNTLEMYDFKNQARPSHIPWANKVRRFYYNQECAMLHDFADGGAKIFQRDCINEYPFVCKASATPCINPNVVCPKGYYSVDGACYKIYSDVTGNFYDLNAFCKELGGQISSCDTWPQQYWILGKTRVEKAYYGAGDSLMGRTERGLSSLDGSTYEISGHFRFDRPNGRCFTRHRYISLYSTCFDETTDIKAMCKLVPGVPNYCTISAQ